MSPRSAPVEGAVLSLWRAVVVYRVAAVLIADYLILRWRHLYAQTGVALAVGAAMLAVTAVIAYIGLRGRANRVDLVAADLTITIGLTFATRWAQRPSQFHGSMQTLTTVWAAGPVIEAGVVLGTVFGVCAGALQFAVTAIVRGAEDGRTTLNGVLLVVVGGLAGYITALTKRSEDERMSTAAELARSAERERLTRSIHDGVLQVLGLVHRRGLAAGGEWVELAQEAAVQEANLRALITSGEATTSGNPRTVNLAAELIRLRSATVNVAVPDAAVQVAPAIAEELLAAVRAALHNVSQHAGQGATAWVFLDALPTELNLTVRDDGAGMDPQRIIEAEAEGRLGMARSIRGRVEDLGGTVSVTSRPNAGTEIELTVPRSATDQGRVR